MIGFFPGLNMMNTEVSSPSKERKIMRPATLHENSHGSQTV